MPTAPRMARGGPPRIHFPVTGGRRMFDWSNPAVPPINFSFWRRLELHSNSKYNWFEANWNAHGWCLCHSQPISEISYWCEIRAKPADCLLELICYLHTLNLVYFLYSGQLLLFRGLSIDSIALKSMWELYSKSLRRHNLRWVQASPLAGRRTGALRTC